MAFATTDDIETRLMRTLSAAEADAAALLLENVQAEIEDVIGLVEADLSAVPGVLKSLTIEVVARALAIPVGASSTSEGLGAYNYRVGYQETDGSLLSDAEERRARAAVHGANSASSRPPAIVDDLHDLADDGEIDGSWPES